jgi:hypothetical protein
MLLKPNGIKAMLLAKRADRAALIHRFHVSAFSHDCYLGSGATQLAILLPTTLATFPYRPGVCLEHLFAPPDV